jgi:hypothetical protein
VTASPFIVWLGWACYAGAAFAIVVYLRHLLGSQPHKRPWSAAGLLFTSLAMGQTPFLFEDAYSGSQIARAAVVTACLLTAVALQAYLLINPRSDEAPAPPGPPPEPEPPTEGPDA